MPARPGTVEAYVIAEIGVNHDGDPDKAHALIEAVAACGVSAVKLQAFEPDLLASRQAPTAPYQRRATGATDQHQMLAALRLPEESWPALARHARELGLDFVCSIFDPPSVARAVELGPPFLKIPSGEITNLPLLRIAAGTGVPLVLSTGMADLEEVAAALEVVGDATSLMHCVSAYPCPFESCNLTAITTLRERFGLPVGWSDHTVDHRSALIAYALGARLFEKHVTLDREAPGPDHAASATPSDLAAYVRELRATARSLGDGVKRTQPIEQEVAAAARRSWHAARPLAPGEVLGEGDALLLRPAAGLPPATAVVGAVVRRPVAAGAPLQPEDLDLTTGGGLPR